MKIQSFTIIFLEITMVGICIACCVWGIKIYSQNKQNNVQEVHLKDNAIEPNNKFKANIIRDSSGGISGITFEEIKK